MRSSWLFGIMMAVAVALGACAAPPATLAPVPPTVPPAPTSVPATSVPTATATVAQLVATTALQSTAAMPQATETAPKPTATSASPTAQAKATGSSKAKINLNDYFPTGPGRDLVLESCMGCHSIAPVLVARKTKSEWEATAENHRELVSRLTKEEFKALFDYLSANFDPSKPVPELPPELLSGFTNY